MLWAKGENGGRIDAQPERDGWCPICGDELIPKCGPINVWHWAHQNKEECDPWAEPESFWHYNWKDAFPGTWQEVTVGEHRADIKTGTGLVIELQSSSIGVPEMIEREKYYGEMMWIVRADEFRSNLDIRRRSARGRRGCYYTFRWKWARTRWGEVDKPVILDFGGDDGSVVDPAQKSLFQLKKFYTEDGPPYGGWGYYVSWETLKGRIGFSVPKMPGEEEQATSRPTPDNGPPKERSLPRYKHCKECEVNLWWEKPYCPYCGKTLGFGARPFEE